MGDKQSKPIEYYGPEQPNNEGKPNALIIFKYSYLTPDFDTDKTKVDVAFPDSKEDKLVVKIDGVLRWNNVLYGEIIKKECKWQVNDKNITVVLVKKNKQEDWPTNQWNSG